MIITKIVFGSIMLLSSIAFIVADFSRSNRRVSWVHVPMFFLGLGGAVLIVQGVTNRQFLWLYAFIGAAAAVSGMVLLVQTLRSPVESSGATVPRPPMTPGIRRLYTVMVVAAIATMLGLALLWLNLDQGGILLVSSAVVGVSSMAILLFTLLSRGHPSR